MRRQALPTDVAVEGVEGLPLLQGQQGQVHCTREQGCVVPGQRPAACTRAALVRGSASQQAGWRSLWQKRLC